MKRLGIRHSGGRYHEQTWAINQNDSGCDQLPVLASDTRGTAFGGNLVQVTEGFALGPGGVIAQNAMIISFELLDVYGPPGVLALIPDGTQIIEAHIEVTTSGLQRVYWENGVPDYSLIDIDYAVIGLSYHDPNSFDVLGTVPGAANGQKVIDFTSVIQAMYAERDTGKYAGYGTLFVPAGFDSVQAPPGPPPYTVIPDPGYPCGQRIRFSGGSTLHLTWDGVSFGQAVIKLQYPESEFNRELLMPRLPVMA